MSDPSTESERAHQGQITLLMVVLAYPIASAGMMVFNKLALRILPPFSLVAVQALFAALAMACTSFDLGSAEDRKRFAVVPGFFIAMLCSSALALHEASITMLILVRNTTPLATLVGEVLVFDRPQLITGPMVASLLGAVAGAALYCWSDLRVGLLGSAGLAFAFANMVTSAGDRIANRWVVYEKPVGMNTEGMVLINNAVTFVFASAMAWHLEHAAALTAWKGLARHEAFIVFMSCCGGVGIGIAGFAAQRRITATGMQVLNNSNKVVVILVEVLLLGKVLTITSLAGCCVGLASGAAYSVAVMYRDSPERKTLLGQP